MSQHHRDRVSAQRRQFKSITKRRLIFEGLEPRQLLSVQPILSLRSITSLARQQRHDRRRSAADHHDHTGRHHNHYCADHHNHDHAGRHDNHVHADHDNRDKAYHDNHAGDNHYNQAIRKRTLGQVGHFRSVDQADHDYADDHNHDDNDYDDHINVDDHHHSHAGAENTTSYTQAYFNSFANVPVSAAATQAYIANFNPSFYTQRGSDPRFCVYGGRCCVAFGNTR